MTNSEKITLNTTLEQLNLPSDLKVLIVDLQNKIDDSYHFRQENYFKKNLGSFTYHIIIEEEHLNVKELEDKKILKNKIKNYFFKEFDFEQIFKNSIDENEFISNENYHFLLSYLANKKLKLDNKIMDYFFNSLNGNKSDYSDYINFFLEAINFFEYESYEKFKEDLNIIMMKDTNYKVTLNYDLQKMLFEFLDKNYPEKIEDNKNYLEDYLNTDLYSTKDFFQKEIRINCFNLFKVNNLKNKDIYQIVNLIDYINAMSESENFEKLFNINSKEIYNKKTKATHKEIIIKISSESSDLLNKYENLLMKSLKLLLPNLKKYEVCSDNDDYDYDEPKLSNLYCKNLNEEILYKIFLNDKIKDQLSSNKNNNPNKI